MVAAAAGVRAGNGSITIVNGSNTYTFTSTGSIAKFTAPTTGAYTITAVGAGGGAGFEAAGGLGASEKGTVQLIQGFVLDIVVGQVGDGTESVDGTGGGGGGTFVHAAPEPTSIALFGAGMAGLMTRRRCR